MSIEKAGKICVRVASPEIVPIHLEYFGKTMTKVCGKSIIFLKVSEESCMFM